MTRQMRSLVNLDSVTMICPCGASVTGEGDIITDFVEAHRDHTDGTCLEETTDDGARAWGKNPPPEVYNLPHAACPFDTNGDGDCGRRYCPHCGDGSLSVATRRTTPTETTPR